MVNIEGYLVKKGGLTWNRRYFVLADKVLTYYMRQGEDKPRGQMVFNETTKLQTITSRSNGFSLTTADRTIYVASESAREFVQWKEAIEAAIVAASAPSAAGSLFCTNLEINL